MLQEFIDRVFGNENELGLAERRRRHRVGLIEKHHRLTEGFARPDGVDDLSAPAGESRKSLMRPRSTR